MRIKSYINFILIISSTGILGGESLKDSWQYLNSEYFHKVKKFKQHVAQLFDLKNFLCLLNILLGQIPQT